MSAKVGIFVANMVFNKKYAVHFPKSKNENALNNGNVATLPMWTHMSPISESGC